MTAIAILGLGGRGLCYGLNVKHRDDIRFTGLCDLDPAKCEKMVSELECPEARVFIVVSCEQS